MRRSRSTCMINRGVELLGDQWSLIIVRDITFYDHRTFRELLTRSREAITPSVLSARLKALVESGVLRKDPAPRGAQGRYSLTELGVQLVPLLFELARVGALLDPDTTGMFDEWIGHPDRIQEMMADLRQRHVPPDPADAASA